MESRANMTTGGRGTQPSARPEAGLFSPKARVNSDHSVTSPLAVASATFRRRLRAAHARPAHRLNGGQALKNCPNKTAPFLVSETNRGFLRADSNATSFGTRCHVCTRSDALRGECEPCDRRISPMCESLTKSGALMFVPAYLSLLLAMAVPFAPGDALRFLLLSLCFMFLGAGVAFLVASDIVRGR